MVLHVVVPLAVAFGLLGTVAATPVSDRLDRVLTRIALRTFGSYVRGRGSVNPERERSLRAAHLPTTYSEYAAKSLLYAAMVALAGSILGVYVVWGAFLLVGVPAGATGGLPGPLATLVGMFAVPSLGLVEVFVLLVVSNATLGVTAGLLTYQLRWWIPRYLADERGRKIDESMERTVAFVYALSRSGMAFPEVLAILARNRGVYGEAAEEVHVAVKDMELFGTDVLAALERVARRSPSTAFGEFAENLVSVLRSGRSRSAFLRDQYEGFKEESASQQQQFLDLLATLAEAYVTILVAGPLFLITILAIVGLVLGGTLRFLRVFAYLLIPLATFGFVVYLDSLTESVDFSRDRRTGGPAPAPLRDVRSAEAPAAGRTDGGTAEPSRNRGRLAAYDRFRGLRRRLRNPVSSVVQRPVLVLYATAPLASVYVTLQVLTLRAAGSLTVRAVDDVLVHATLLLVGGFALAYEVHTRRIERIEAAVPDLLDRLASVNEAGMPIRASIGRVARSDLGALDAELDRIWTDVRWGARVEDALYRFEERVQTAIVTRMVTLVTNAMQASGDIGPVLRIAADQAQAGRRLKRERRQELLTYSVVIYLSFFVFLTIVGALSVIFLPSVPTAESVGSQLGGTFGSVSEADKAAYELVFFHTVLVQAVCSGFVAGQMGEDDWRAGAKHATAMLAIAYLVVLVLG